MPSVPAGRVVVVIEGGDVMLIVTVADFVVSATEVAVTMAEGSALETSGLVVEVPLAMPFATAPTAGAL